jgi:hypothetical protein
MNERQKYKPGSVFRWDAYEVVAKHDNDRGCDRCIGQLHAEICDALPFGCNDDGLIWRPLNDTARLMVVTLTLEGKITKSIWR